MSVKCLKKKEEQKSFCSPLCKNVLFSVLSIDISALFRYAFSAASWYSSISSRICSAFFTKITWSSTARQGIPA